MEVGRDARADSLQLEQASDTVTVEPVKNQGEADGNQGEKPPARPHGWEDSECDDGGSATGKVVRVHGAHQELVTPRGQPVGYAPLLGWRAPISVRSFELVLVTQHFAGRKAQPDEINLQLVLTEGQIRQSHIGLAESRHELARPGHLKTAD